MIFAFALRNLRANPKLALFFCLNLVLGLSGFLAVDSFKRSFESSMQAQSKLLLGADLVVSSRRALTAEEDRALKAGVVGATETRMVNLLSMLRRGNGSRLADIQAIESAFPFYGEISLEDGRRIHSGDAEILQKSPLAWLAPELAFQLSVKKGDEVTLGNQRFRVDGIVKDDTSQSWKGFSLAPSAYVGFHQMPATGLVREGTSLSFEWFYRFSEDARTLRAQNTLLQTLTDPGIRIASHEKASERVSQVLDQVNDYLGLVALVGLFLSSIGAAYLFRSFLSAQITEFGILQVLGLRRGPLLFYSLVQVAVLGACSGLIALGVSAAVQPILIRVLQGYLTSPIRSQSTFSTAFVALLLGICGSLFLCLPLVWRLRALRPAELFQEGAVSSVRARTAILPWVPALLLFSGLAFQQAHSWRVAGIFTLALLGSFLVLGGLGLAVLRLLASLAGLFSRYEVKVALRTLARARLNSLSALVAISLGAILLNIVPQLERNLARELVAPTGKALPSLFLFDIQDEQITGVEKYFVAEDLPLQQLSPMIRARLTKVNEKPFARDDREYAPRTREEGQEARAKNRTFNLTYRAKVSDAETIVAGRDFTEPYIEGKETPPEVTLEERFADRLGLKLDDLLEFDVLGVPVLGKVVGLRRVNWLSFQPNFFITFQAGSLQEAPKVWLAALPKLEIQRKLKVQSGLVEEFPNISILDVENTVAKTTHVFDLIARAISWMAAFSLLTGFAVLFSMSAYRARERRRDMNLLKVLGADRRSIYRLISLEMFILAGTASFLGSMISFAFAGVLVRKVFDLPWVPNFQVPLLIGLGTTVLAVVIGLLTTARVVRADPITLLQDAR